MKFFCYIPWKIITRCTANESLRRSPSEVILCADDMIKFCTSTFPTIIIKSISAEDIATASSTVEQRALLSSTLDGTRSYHYFDHVGNGKVGAKVLSTDDNFEVKVDQIPISNNCIDDFSPGNHVAYLYDQKWYIGTVSAIEKELNELKISSMHPHGPASSFFWPQRNDIISTPLALVLAKIL